MSQRLAVAVLSPDFSVENVPAELTFCPTGTGVVIGVSLIQPRRSSRIQWDTAWSVGLAVTTSSVSTIPYAVPAGLAAWTVLLGHIFIASGQA